MTAFAFIAFYSSALFCYLKHMTCAVIMFFYTVLPEAEQAPQRSYFPTELESMSL